MLNFLILFSLVLNGIAILAIINLYLRQNRLQETENKLDHTFKEMESTISSYLFEMKEENDAFIQRFKKLNEGNELKNQAPFDVYSLPRTVDESTYKQEKQQSKTGENQFSQIEHTSRLQAINTYKKQTSSSTEQVPPGKEIGEKWESNDEPSIKENNELPEETPTFQQLQEKLETDEASLYEEIVQLQQAGLSSAEIAKRLDKGKTEVELILKLR